MALKAKIKFKSSHPDGSRDDSDVIVIKVKRNNWNEFSKLLGAGRSNTELYSLSYDDAVAIEQTFDNIFDANT